MNSKPITPIRSTIMFSIYDRFGQPIQLLDGMIIKIMALGIAATRAMSIMARINIIKSPSGIAIAYIDPSAIAFIQAMRDTDPYISFLIGELKDYAGRSETGTFVIGNDEPTLVTLNPEPSPETDEWFSEKDIKSTRNDSECSIAIGADS